MAEIHDLIPEGPHLDDSDYFYRKSWLIGLMFRHFPKLRPDQIEDYSISQMEKVLRENGVNLD